MLQHCWDDSRKQFAAQLETGIGVNFDQPDIVAGVNHEIQSEYLEIMLGVVGIQLQVGSFDSVKSDLLHPWVDHL